MTLICVTNPAAVQAGSRQLKANISNSDRGIGCSRLAVGKEKNDKASKSKFKIKRGTYMRKIKTRMRRIAKPALVGFMAVVMVVNAFAALSTQDLTILTPTDLANSLVGAGFIDLGLDKILAGSKNRGFQTQVRSDWFPGLSALR